MKVTLVAKLKLHPTPEQFKALRQTQLAYRDALNYVSQYAYEHGKMSNKVHLQDGTYREIRARFKIPAQMACSIPRKARSHLQGPVDQSQEEGRPMPPAPNGHSPNCTA